MHLLHLIPATILKPRKLELQNVLMCNESNKTFQSKWKKVTLHEANKKMKRFLEVSDNTYENVLFS